MLVFLIILLLAAQAASAQTFNLDESAILSRCPTLTRMMEDGTIGRINNPIFEDREEARKFAADCSRVVQELSSIPGLPENYAATMNQAALAAEFMTGDTYLLSTSNVSSVIKLRERVKIPPPPGFVYVKKYKSVQVMPPIVAVAFQQLSPSEGARVEGVTILGRYIALLETEYHDELVDNLSHEMVHAYLTCAARSKLPKWFQEGAAVYFSTGKESTLYGKTGVPNMKQVTLPEDYKRKLHSFQYLEDKVGRARLFDYIRNAVKTGNTDVRPMLGIHDINPPTPKPIWIAVLVVGLVAITLFTFWYISYRRETWID